MWVETGESSYQVIKKATTIRESFWHWWWSKEKKKVNEWDRILWASILWFYTHLPIWYQKFNSFNFPHQQHMLMLSFKIFLQHRDLWVTRHATLLFFFFFTAFICKLLNLNVSHWTHVIIHQKLIFIMQEKKIKIICII